MPSTDAPAPHPRDPARPAAAEVLRALLATIRAETPGTVAGEDPEHLHDLRIAVRRTRSILRELHDLFPGDVHAAAKELFSDLAAATGPARDLDVHLLDWDDQLQGLELAARTALEPVRAELQRRQAEAHAALRSTLESEATTSGLAAWDAWLEEAASVTPESEVPTIGWVVRRRIRKLHRKLVRDGRAISRSTPGEQLHELRKEGKRLRYLVDCFAPMFGGKVRSAYVAQLKDLQDNLGAHQDAEVQVDLLRELARQLDPAAPAATETLLALGQLIERGDTRRRAERAAFAKRFQAFDRKRNRTLLERLVDSAR